LGSSETISLAWTNMGFLGSKAPQLPQFDSPARVSPTDLDPEQLELAAQCAFAVLRKLEHQLNTVGTIYVKRSHSSDRCSPDAPKVPRRPPL
jgi:hypothetical protein